MVENIDNIELTDEFKEALNLMENTNDCIFITGKAGTGKTTLQRYFKKHTKKEVLVVAPTGLAAINAEGQTIHSMFRFPFHFLTKADIKPVFGTSIYKEIDAIIIDEVSMVRADMFDAIDYFMRKNGKNRNLPFGGVQLILFGDLYQMPPVVDSDVCKIMEEHYETPYFFSAKVMENFTLKKIELNKVFRQKDPQFIEFLDKIRLGNICDSDLEYINSIVCDTKPTDDYVTLTPTNHVASSINQKKLDELPDKSYSYQGRIQGDFISKKDSSNNNLPVDFELKLKKGARVIFVKNDMRRRWVNGTLGKIEDLGEDFVKVKIDDDSSVVNVVPDTWEKLKQRYDEESDSIIADVIGKYTQIPLKLAWALTIHKAQGQTLNKVYIDLSSGVWEFGHTYVVLSRCRTLNGIILKNNIFLNDIKVDSRITDFLKSKHKKTTQTKLTEETKNQGVKNEVG